GRGGGAGHGDAGGFFDHLPADLVGGGQDGGRILRRIRRGSVEHDRRGRIAGQTFGNNVGRAGGPAGRWATQGLLDPFADAGGVHHPAARRNREAQVAPDHFFEHG